MMKHIIFTAGLLAGAMSGEAMATCGTAIVTDLRAVLPGNTICQGASSPWTAQEMHMGTTGSSTSGNLDDYKLGAGDPIDPTKTLGTYSLRRSDLAACTTNCRRVIYDYTAFGPPNNTYTFWVYLVSGTAGAAGSVYDFCLATSGAASATGTLKIGTGVAC